MDIARLSTELATNRVQTQVGTAMLGKSLDMATEQSAALMKLFEAAAPQQTITDPALGTKVDTYA